jgi:hypothetical protein
LQGWEPREFTRHEYADGVLVASMTEREPEWDRPQLDMMLAYERVMADMGPHGHPMSEATDPQANPSVAGGWHYEANKAPKKDYAAQAIDRAREAFYAQYKDADRSGDVWYATRVDD